MLGDENVAQLVKAEIQFEIPEDKVLVDKFEWESTKEQAHAHEIWGMNDLRKYMHNKSKTWVTDNILKNKSLAKEIKELRESGALCGGGNGFAWMMFADDMKKFIATHKDVIMRGVD